MTSRDIVPSKRLMRAAEHHAFFVRGTRWALVQWAPSEGCLRHRLMPEVEYVMIMALPQVPATTRVSTLPLVTVDANYVLPIANALAGVGDHVASWSADEQGMRLRNWLSPKARPEWSMTLARNGFNRLHAFLPEMHLQTVADLGELRDWCLATEALLQPEEQHWGVDQ